MKATISILTNEYNQFYINVLYNIDIYLINVYLPKDVAECVLIDFSVIRETWEN